MKIEKKTHLVLVAVLAGVLIAGISAGAYLFFSQTKVAEDTTLLQTHQKSETSATDAEKLKKIDTELKDTENDLDTTDLDSDQKDLESVDLTGV